MDAFDMYKECLVLLNQQGSAEFDWLDFNTHVSDAQTEVIEPLLPLYDQDLAINRMLIPLLGNKVELTSNSLEFNLPAECEKLTMVQVEIKLKDDFRCWKKGKTFLRRVERLTDEQEGYALENYYTQPSFDQGFYYKFLGNSIELIVGDEDFFEVTKVNVRFLKNWPEIKINENLQNIQGSIWNRSLTRKIINRTVTRFLEKTKNERLSTHASINS